MARRFPFRLIATVCALAILPLVAHSDELKLKDGSTVKGTIAGYDDNSFKVQTSYGFALVRRDQVVTISMEDSAKAALLEKKPDPAVEKPPAAPEKPKTEKTDAASVAPAPKPVTALPPLEAAKLPEKAPAPMPPKIDAPKAATPKTPDAVATAAPAPTPKPIPSPPAVSVAVAGTALVAASKPNSPSLAAPAPAPVATANTQPTPARTAPPALTPTAAATPPKPPAPEPIRETVTGNTYTNSTYRFQMYKPPDWRVLAAQRTVLPGAIAALGTDDQETYLLIGQEPAGKPLYLAADAADKRLRDAMDNFRPQGQEQMLVAGIWATEHRFRGSVDEHEWSGVVVLVPHGQRLYTIFGMTRADTDLVQIQENVIARAIASIQFADQ